jgi:sugar phosphate isomerase/epimerase
MKTAFCTNIFPHDEIPEALQRLKDIGYDGVEFWQDYLESTNPAA